MNDVVALQEIQGVVGSISLPDAVREVRDRFGTDQIRNFGNGATAKSDVAL